METHYYHAASKKEAIQLISEYIKQPFTVELYKRMSKGNSLYKLILA